MNAMVMGATSLSLEAQQDESLLIRDIRVQGSTAVRAVASVGQRTVGAWRTAGALGNHLQFPLGGPTPGTMMAQTLLSWLYMKELWRGIPVPAGYTFSLRGLAGASCVAQVIYDRHDAQDFGADLPNGPEGGELDYLSYGQPAAAITTASSVELTKPTGDNSFPPFPYGSPAPANHDSTIYGVLASTFIPAASDATNAHSTSFLRLVDQRRILGDKVRQGYLLWRILSDAKADAVGDGQSQIHNFSDADRGLPFMLMEPRTYAGGEELQVFMQTQSKGSGAAIATTDLEVALIMRSVRRR